MRNAVKMTTMVAVAAMASACFSDTVTWIGGSRGAAKTAANWDPEGLPDAPNEALITNTVTFTESGTSVWWYFSRVTVSNNSTVTYSARFASASSAAHLSPDKECFVDVVTGSQFKPGYIIGQAVGGTASQATFVKLGGGTLETGHIGHGGNFFKNVWLKEGKTIINGELDNGFMATTGIKVDAGAELVLKGANCIVADSKCKALVTVNGLLDLSGTAQKMDGLSGTGVITNASAGITLRMVRQGQNEFSGRIFGWLNVAPVSSAPAGACLVIGDANTLKYADLTVTPTAAIPNPVKFKPGIGVFYVRRFPADMTFYDTDGNPVELRTFSQNLYVDASRPDDSGDGLTRATAYKTLAAAMASPNLTAASGEYNIVHVAPGVYSNGTMGASDDLSRVVVPANVSLESDAGAEHTFIIGQVSANPPANCHGCGLGAVRCAKLASGARIQGFTLTGGHTYATASNKGVSGGGVYCAGAGSVVADCIISNNVSFRGGGGYQGTYIRTKILSNIATEIGSGLYAGCTLYNCIFDGNGGTGFYCPSWSAYMYNCVFGPNGTSIRADGTKDDKRAHAYNTIFMSKIVVQSVGTEKKMKLHNCVTMDAVPADTDLDADCIVTNGFANAAAKFKWLGFDNDFRPVKAMPGCIVDGGIDSYYKLSQLEGAAIDMGGNPRFSGAAIDLGPYEVDVTRAFVSFEDAGGGIAAEGISPGITNLPAGGSIAFTLRRTFDSAALCTGFTVNGEFFDFEDYPDGWTTNITNGARVDSLDICAVYADKPTMWVDEVRGNDANAGYHPSVPKKSLAAAFTPTLPSGAVVYVAPGWYTNETMNSNVDSGYGTQLSRVVVPNGVSLISLEGADKTFIGGAASTNPPAANRYGCGPDSIRCVTLGGSSALLRGFTCFGGRVNCSTTTTSYGYNGGGVKGSGVAEDCVFTNCVAVRGGGASSVTACRRCRFVNCSAVSIGTAMNECSGAYNCVFASCGGYITLYTKPVVSCTFLPSNTGNAIYYQVSADNPVAVAGPSNVVNSAILCDPYYSANKLPSYTHCVFISGTDLNNAPLGEGSIVIQSSKAAALENLKMNADGSLQKGSPLIDVGENLLYTNVQTKAGTTDKSGGQRVYNRTIDIGAYEYDWRGDFAEALRNPRRALAVTAASENVTTNAADGVTLSGGDSLSVEWEHADYKTHDFSFVVSVSGEGTFTYAVAGGEPVEVAATGEPQTIEIRDVSGTLDVRLDFTGAGRAAVSQFKRGGYGLSLIIR